MRVLKRVVVGSGALALAFGLSCGAGTPAVLAGECHKAKAKVVSLREKPSADIVETAVAAGSFKTLAAALNAAGLVETLQGEGPFTVFAPTDDAFAKLPAGTVESLLKPENKAKLVAILTYHVVPGKVLAADVVKLKSAKTVQGGLLAIDTADGVKVNDSRVAKADIDCANGVIHVIDSVLLPPQ